MKIVDVIPLSRGINRDTLSYFSVHDVPAGAIVKVPLRGRTVSALVVSARSAEENRQELKNAAFSFKKTSSVVSQDLLSAPFMATARKSADFHVATLGSLLFSIVPKIVLENAKDLVSSNSPEQTGESTGNVPQTPRAPQASDTPSAILTTPAPHSPKSLHGAVLQTSDEERFSNYRSLVREEFAKGRSVFLCLPTTGDIKKAERLLEKGIAEYSYILHGQIKKKELTGRWNALAIEPHPILIIGTGQFLCVPRHDIGTIIIERESSRVYKSQSRPFTDLRLFAEMFSKEIGAKIIFGDTLLRTETFWRYKNDELRDIVPPTLRLSTTGEQKIVDMRERRKTEAKFEPISKELEILIKNAIENNERLFIFSSRRGLSPNTLCADCGTVVVCKRCKTPIVLHSKPAERFFLCHRCGEKRDANEKCANCTGWRLQTLGIGIELIYEEIKKRIQKSSGNSSERTVLRIDSDTVKTNAEAEAIVKKFYDSPGGILIGTEMALLYLGQRADQQIENVAIASIDSMFSIPDFRIREKIISILIRLRLLAQKRFIIQSRNVTEPVFAFAEKGNLLDFYKLELADRQNFDYPPFTTLIKISLSGERRSVQAQMTTLAESLQEFNVSIYPAFSPFAKGVYTMHALIKIGRSRWIEPKLFEKLRDLPPSFSVDVDPESVL